MFTHRGIDWHIPFKEGAITGAVNTGEGERHRYAELP